MPDPIISVEGISKRYRLRHQSAGYTTLRDSLTDWAKGLVGGRRADAAAPGADEEFWALKDVSFDINRGEVVGIIGRNGAGKSTLLKVLSRITEPTSGRIRLRGRVASLLEVGTGFHPELSGRENIFLNGAILGMTKSEIKAKFDEIVAFSEVEKFLDTPVKHYSSGMYVRLAFAVAAHLDPEILIVDEVLAVGDAQFQKKCLGKMKDVATGGRTVLFVSHNMAAVQALCSRGLMMTSGRLIQNGRTDHVIKTYLEGSDRNIGSSWVRPSSLPRTTVAITGVSVVLNGSQPRHTLSCNIELEADHNAPDIFVAINIRDSSTATIMQALPKPEPFIPAISRHVLVDIELPPLVPGIYTLDFWVGSHNTTTLDLQREVASFEVLQAPTPGRTFPYDPEHGRIVPPSTCTTPFEK
jgi:lipopolysaccharide transport system ATP-binding protein